MSLAAYIFLAITFAIIVAVVVYAVRARALPGPSLIGKTVVVNTRRPDDQTVRGVLVAHHADRLTLSDAVVVHGAGSSVAVTGLIHVPLIGISTVQEIIPSLEPAESAAVLNQ